MVAWLFPGETIDDVDKILVGRAMYRCIVVGRGLIGSAATRHLAETGDGIACVGPDEPGDRAAHTGVFASHYDEGRMTRVVDPEPEWSITAKLSIERYRDLEARSGVRFFTPSGYLGIGAPRFDYNARCASTGARNGATLERLDAAGIRARYPFLSVADDADGWCQTNLKRSLNEGMSPLFRRQVAATLRAPPRGAA